MTNPNESAHDADTGAPAEGVTLNEGKTVPAPGLSVFVDEGVLYGYHADSHSLVQPWVGETHDGKDGWVKVHLANEGGEHDDVLDVNVVPVDDES